MALLASTGIAYIISGLIFRIPISVQPLKSLALAAVVIGATQAEVRLAGSLLGLTCLGISCFNVNGHISKIPRPLVHGIQLGLGIILITKGFSLEQSSFLLIILIVSGILVASKLSFPLLGILATGGFFYAFFHHSIPPMSELANAHEGAHIRLSIILYLLLPQVVLTFSNSVIATYDVSRRYFTTRASRVTPQRLLLSIGFGNLISATFGGLPYCHGSGGVTAHVKGGANHFSSNLIIGSTLLIFALFQHFSGAVNLSYPPILLSSLLISTGIFHLQLAKPTWASSPERPRLLLMAITALITQNMLATLCVGLYPELFKFLRYSFSKFSFSIGGNPK